MVSNPAMGSGRSRDSSIFRMRACSALPGSAAMARPQVVTSGRWARCFPSAGLALRGSLLRRLLGRGLLGGSGLLGRRALLGLQALLQQRHEVDHVGGGLLRSVRLVVHLGGAAGALDPLADD